MLKYIQDIYRIPGSGGGPPRAAVPMKQAAPLSVAIVVHQEQWADTADVGMAMLVGGQNGITHGVLRFRHGQRAERAGQSTLAVVLDVFLDKRGDADGCLVVVFRVVRVRRTSPVAWCGHTAAVRLG